MSFEIDLRARLLDDATVAAIVGTRVYWKIRPQNSALPCIVIGTVSGARDQHMDGPMGTQGNRMQFDCLAKQANGVGGKDNALALRNAVMAVIESGGIEGDTEFQGGLVNLYRDDAADTASGVVHTEMIDATIWFNEFVS
jgi:hypothetical protein